MILVLFSLLPCAEARSDNIRGGLIDSVTITPDNQQGYTGSVRLEDLIAVDVADEYGLINCLGLEIQQTEEQRKYYGSFGIYLYTSVVPSPDSSIRGYTGTNVLLGVLPASASVLYQIPLKQEYKPSGTLPAVLIQKPVEKDRLPLLATILPLMKGVPSRAAEEPIRLRIFPILSDFGLSDIAIEYEGEQKASAVLVDGKEVILSDKPLILASGIHLLTVKMSEEYKKEVNLIVEKGKRSTVRVLVENPDAKIYFSIPEGGSLFVDGEKLNVIPSKPRELEPGFHTFTIRIGDYSMSKNITLNPGKTYTISIIMDMNIKEKEEKK